MKKFLYLLATALIILLTLGCQSPLVEEEKEIQLAPIHEVTINIAESHPPQVFVYIKGGLADSCTTFHELKTERSGNTLEITVTTERPKDEICAQVYSYFEKNVNLGTEFTSGETYMVNVNDKRTSFIMQ
jgi:inhibitor of cysteine peptidase